MKKLILLTLMISLLSLPLIAGGGGGGISDPLVSAVINAEIEEVKKIVEEEKNPKIRLNVKDEFGRTPLMWAAYINYASKEERLEIEQKRIDIVSYLIEKGADVNLRDNDGWSALMWACWSSLPAMTELFMNKGADVSFAGKKGWTALMLASFKGNATVVKNLLAKGADKIDTNKRGETALILAQKGFDKYPHKGDFETVLKLLQQ